MGGQRNLRRAPQIGGRRHGPDLVAGGAGYLGNNGGFGGGGGGGRDRRWWRRRISGGGGGSGYLFGGGGGGGGSYLAATFNALGSYLTAGINSGNGYISILALPAPEPATASLLATALLGFGLARRRRS